MNTPVNLNENTEVRVTKAVPDTGAVAYVVHAGDEALVECAAPDHAAVIAAAIEHGGNSYGRERVARQVLSKAAGTDFWNGNAIWLTPEEFKAVIDARGVPDHLREKFAAKLRERDEEHSATFGGDPPADESQALVETESVEDLKNRLLEE